MKKSKPKCRDLKPGMVIYSRTTDFREEREFRPVCWVIERRKEDDSGWWLSGPVSKSVGLPFRSVEDALPVNGIADYIFDDLIGDYEVGESLRGDLDAILTSTCP